MFFLNYYLNISLVFSSVFFLLACSSNSSKDLDSVSSLSTVKNSLTHNRGPVLIFGDSIAHGQGSSSDDKNILGCMKSFTDREVFKISFPGGTSRDLAPLVENYTIANPSLVIISLAGNDVLEHSSMGTFPEAETYKHMKNIFFDFLEVNSLALYIGLNPPKFLADAAGIDASRLKKVNQIAVEQGAILIPNGFEGMWGNSDLMADNLHPNDKGYAILCERIQNALRPYFSYILVN